MTFKTDQEAFWAGGFGDEYASRNQGETLITSNVVLFGNMLRSAPGVRSVVELGCNIGLNLQALNRIDPEIALCGYEINGNAVQKARDLGIAEIHHQTIIEAIPAATTYDLAFTKGVLIHIHPDELPRVYDNLFALSRRYILVCEYYNPSPVTVNYRGNADRLFKRDFAGELMDRFGLSLVDYGFTYRRDNYFPQDDCNWFLLEKPL
ncbi:MAG: methyltransferase domain-containing protein [Phenylobacterium sp.]|jgi:pseudaminic acid biosynthesis-associated methylase|uniref:pseudaminic acid biosynthesis-associated methylase n=3 Tax=Phenylobacterium sp. TaxID=1871053 RepID=UPI0025E4A7CA|nr:pseudaminic acid biosynthesis-associated methylase [Phenylobacterium sp.]MCA3715727.1 methyltransferase domain-containing protein [Phenylobacterium sp.]MCA6246726.1 methyltransferase domain-containing protein [Phenylobacterium sp.]MCA6255992.1 methyltransferase domain-containing protein [Phenylobacterium sp.]MCA6282700.1 methyltransferase domain-containing protein [Phenylobacterium sp.]